jgi:peptidoglycan/LPS O-acetylase OafA/YrhL
MPRDENARADGVPARFYSLDALRGVAALAVIFWHWQDFFFHGTQPDPQFSAPRQPFYSLFRPFYTDGWRAVDLFFCLSGFVFHWLYAQKISDRAVSAREFSVLRFSRLYPLHLVTLLFVAGAQVIWLQRSGSFFVYKDNDLYHFGLQLMMASNWGLERGPSFNVPIWSVSVEVFLYALFFCACLLTRQRWLQLAAFAGAAFSPPGPDPPESSGAPYRLPWGESHSTCSAGLRPPGRACAPCSR